MEFFESKIPALWYEMFYGTLTRGRRKTVQNSASAELKALRPQFSLESVCSNILSAIWVRKSQNFLENRGIQIPAMCGSKFGASPLRTHQLCRAVARGEGGRLFAPPDANVRGCFRLSASLSIWSAKFVIPNRTTQGAKQTMINQALFIGFGMDTVCRDQFLQP